MKQFLFLFIITSNLLFSQSFIIKDLDNSNYPNMSAKLFYLDEYNERLNTDGILINENSELYQCQINCPPIAPPENLSIILTIDISGSMSAQNNMIAAQTAARKLIELSDAQNEEIAITSFDDLNYLNQDFTNNKNLLTQKVNELFPNGGTDYEMGIYLGPSGATKIASRARNKVVIVFLTDGISGVDKETALTELNSINAEFYAVSLKNIMTDELRELAIETGGASFENIQNTTDLIGVYQAILFNARGGEACDISWVSETCESERQVRASSGNGQSSNSLFYEVDADLVGSLTFPDKLDAYFGEIEPGNFSERTFRIVAGQLPISINNIFSSNGEFSIIDWGGENPPFSLLPGDERTLTVRFEPSIEEFQFSRFEIESNTCIGKYFYMTGGKKNTQDRNITILEPNGGELYLVNSDTNLRWEGGAQDDTFRVEYSLNAGADWNLITDQAIGNEYFWQNIPNNVSQNCLLRVSFDGSDEPEWSELIFSRFSDVRTLELKADSDGNVVMAGVFDGQIEFFNETVIDQNGPDQEVQHLFIAKFNKDKELLWTQVINADNRIVLNALDVDINGNVIFGGQFRSQIEVNNVTHTSPTDALDMFVCKLNQDGDILFFEQANNENYQEITSIATGLNGQIYVAGIVLEEVKYGNFSEPLPDDDQFYEYQFFMFHLNENLEYQNRIITNGQSEVRSDTKIATNSDGELYIALTYFGENFLDWGTGGLTLKVPTQRDIYIAKLNDQLEVIEDQYLESNGNLDVLDIDSRFTGELYLTGKYNRDIRLPGGDVIPKQGTDNNVDIFLTKFNSSLESIWSKGFGSDQNDSRSKLTALSDGGVVMCSAYLGDIILDTETIIPNPGILNNILLVRYDADGIFPQIRNIKQEGNSYPLSLTSDNSDIYYLGGQFVNSIFEDELEVVSPSTDLFIRKFADSVSSASDISDDLWEIYDASNGNIQFINEVDFGDVLVGNQKDTLVEIHITNEMQRPIEFSNFEIIGAPDNIFYLVSNIENVAIESSESIDLEFRFSPNMVSNFQQEIRFIFESGEQVQTTLIGNGVESGLNVLNPVIDFGKVPIDDSRQRNGELIINNFESNEVRLNSFELVGPDNDQFSFNVTDSIIPPNGQLLVDFSFNPSIIGRTSSKFEVTFDNVSSPANALLLGEGVSNDPIDIEIYTDNKSSFAGSLIQLPVKINDPQTLLNLGVSRISTTMSFNSTLLTPRGNTPDGEFNNYKLFVPLEFEVNNNEIQEEYSFFATLGDSPSTEIDFLNTTLLFANGISVDFINISERSSTFSISNICYEGGERLIIDRGRLDFSIAPNPISDKIHLEMNLIEKGMHSISLYDYTGKYVSEIYSADFNPGLYTINYPCNNISPGRYFLLVKSPSETYTLEVIKEN